MSSVMASPRGFRLPAETAPRKAEVQARRERREGRERARGHGIEACRDAHAQRPRAEREVAACERSATAATRSYDRWARGEGEREAKAVRQQRRVEARGMRESKQAQRGQATRSVPRDAYTDRARRA